MKHIPNPPPGIRMRNEDLTPGLLDRLLAAYHRMRQRPDRPSVPPVPEMDVEDHPPSAEEYAEARAAACKAIEMTSREKRKTP